MYRSIFLNENIEFCASLPLSECRINKEHLLRELCFEPKNVLIFLVPYFFKDERERNISLYAVPRDYHFYMKELFERILPRLKELYPQSSFKGFSDHSPIYEREAAAKAGLGIIGDNGLLINEKYGSYIFVGDVLTDIEPQLLGAVEPRGLATCIHCGECKRLCPTGILRGEEKSCLSAITQRKGELFNFEVDLMRKVDTVWGCDVCQEHCPYNRNPVTTPIEFFHKELILRLDRDTVDAMDKEALRKRAFGWRGRRVLERNLDCVYAKNK